MAGQLFTQYFLTDGIKSTEDWNATFAHPDAFNRFRDGARCLLASFIHFQDPNEATTEQELIRPLLDLLGWADYLPQQGAARNEDIPDLLLFSDAESKARAAARTHPDDRFHDATVVAESKRFGRPLDARGDPESPAAAANQPAMLDVPAERPASRRRGLSPHGQILRYLSTADSATDGRLRWGVLTDGGVWRLYDQRARPRATGYFEADLAEHIADDGDALRAFFLLFRRRSFVLRPGATATFLETALAEGRRYEQQVAQDLSSMVFERAFPDLIKALLDAGGADLAEVRQAALILLYRLLFVLYAEDRGLLPVNDSRYDDYGLRKRVRDDIARRMDAGDTFSSRAGNYYDRVTTLAGLIDAGDDSIGLPPYNGGLFAADVALLLNSVRLPDAAFAPIVYDLSHAEIDGRRQFVNYRDMSVQQLGSIYERLLEREPVRNSRGEIETRLNPYARKDSGSFYTPQELVDLILDQTLKPLAEERLAAFEDKARELASDRRPKADRKAELERLDPAEAVLELKVLDPAMGSGHFLVTAVDFLADYVADLIEYVPAVPEWLDGDDAYESPLLGRVAAIRRDILQRARDANWVMDAAQLSDQTIIRRMVLKRCIYGVDKNPLTVELAKVSLWLHSFTVGAPLSFLDHHLRCGDSLLGLRVLDARQDFDRLGGLSASSAIAGAEAATAGMQRIERLSDADVAEVKESAGLFEGVEQATADLRGVLDFLAGLRWQTAGLKKRALATVEGSVVEALGRESSIAFDLLARGPDAADGEIARDDIWREFTDRWTQSRAIADREEFLHWEVAFPGVWHHWQSRQPEGGFDAVIGNPPWDRIKLQEVEWFATRDPAIARAPTAAARKAAIQQLRDQAGPAPSTWKGEGWGGGPPAPSPGGEGRGEGHPPATLVAAYDAAKDRADTLGKLIRASGEYPLLGGGDINLYSLFVERAMGLVKPDGFVGLLTPSGIYADKTAARFFQTVSTGGRVGGLFDFENRRLNTDLPPFFPDIDSRFKFCALIFGGAKRTFTESACAFFLHDVAAIDDPDRCFALAPEDFARVNPNTGTAPVFRTRRDAEITRRIYANHPVLVDRSSGEERRVWPVRYVRMFDMTNDSHLFRTAAQLEDEGCYPIQGNRWKKGAELYLPLYQGRMIHQFDHRANSVRVNPESTHNPYLSEEVTEAQHADPAFLPQSQYWVPAKEVELNLPETTGYTLGFRDIARPTDVRTVIACIVPWAGYGNKVPLMFTQHASSSKGHEESDAQYASDAASAATLTANLNAICLDFVARQKVQGTTLNLFILEQLPVIAPDAYDRRFGDVTAAELVRDHVLRLTYTAHDMEPFARDLGYGGDPFIWDEEDRRHLRARLDALYFHLYGLDRADAAYVLDTFPIVRRENEAHFEGHYRTKELILAYMNALGAGDTETVVAV
ncbi:MAG: restriction endonuclease [Chloroflexi bacterium]|nr:restriction endonuclease [Chloroflexota bacterium]